MNVCLICVLVLLCSQVLFGDLFFERVDAGYQRKS